MPSRGVACYPPCSGRPPPTAFSMRRPFWSAVAISALAIAARPPEAHAQQAAALVGVPVVEALTRSGSGAPHPSPPLAPERRGVQYGARHGRSSLGDPARTASRRRTVITGAVVGGVIGTVAGALLGADFARSTCERPTCGVDSDVAKAAAGGALVGALLGAGTGAVVGVVIDRTRGASSVFRAGVRVRVPTALGQ
jgi:hypothetical protein